MRFIQAVHRKPLLHATMAGLGALVLLGLVLLALDRWVFPPPMPRIQGVVLATPAPVPPFQLTDHRGNRFSNADIAGRWHLVSYGFTHCPQFCASTLATMSTLHRAVQEQEAAFADVGLLFYTVDAERDTPQQLARFVPHFHPDLVGLTHDAQTRTSALQVERALGIGYRRVALPSGTDSNEGTEYTVEHGVKLLLLNPQGQLAAVFEPSFHSTAGIQFFSLARLQDDYLAVRRYYAAR